MVEYRKGQKVKTLFNNITITKATKSRVKGNPTIKMHITTSPYGMIHTRIFSPDLPRKPPVTAEMKMEEFQTMMEDQEEFEGESILEDFEDFVMGFIILIPYFIVIH